MGVVPKGQVIHVDLIFLAGAIVRIRPSGGPGICMNPGRVVRVTGCVAAAVLCLTTLAGAQVASSFRGLQSSLHGGERLRITDQAGVVTNGRLTTLSDQSLRLIVQSAPAIDLPESSVAKIEHVTSRVRKGALAGLLGGAAVGAMAVFLTPPCKSFCIGPSRGAVILPVAGMFGGIGAGIGALIGAAMPDRRVIYLSQRPVPRTP